MIRKMNSSFKNFLALKPFQDVVGYKLKKKSITEAEKSVKRIIAGSY